MSHSDITNKYKVEITEEDLDEETVSIKSKVETNNENAHEEIKEEQDGEDEGTPWKIHEKIHILKFIHWNYEH